MKVSLGQIKNSEKSVVELSKAVLPIKVSYRLGKFLKKIAAELKDLEESRITLVNKYGTEDPETKNVSVAEENFEAFVAEFNELLSEEVDLEYEKLDLSGDVLGNEVRLNTQDVLNLEFLCDFEK